MNDEFFLQRTFELAREARGRNWPNPLVGSVIVKAGKIIGEGYHEQYGKEHAEINALLNCTESPEGATLYVNLEPCCHTQKQTPPCAQRLIKEKIKKVVICNTDPNPAVQGKGIELLKDAGIEVIHGLLSAEGEKLNEVFFHAQRTKRPFIHWKSASTLDGKIALPDGQSQWITSERSRSLVHEMRSHHQAILVGAETVRKDNPKLNIRLPNYRGKQPHRIVFTKSGELPREAHLFNDELKNLTLIYTMKNLHFDFPSEQVIKITSLKEALHDLYQKKMISLFLEGGATLASSFLQEGFIDRVSLFLNPSFLGEGLSSLSNLHLSRLNERPRLKDVEVSRVDEDILISGKL